MLDRNHRHCRRFDLGRLGSGLSTFWLKEIRRAGNLGEPSSRASRLLQTKSLSCPCK